MDRAKNIRSYNIQIELIKIVACFLVIYNHTANHGYYLFSIQELGGVKFWIYMVISILCKVGVPFYFMASGAILLGKDDKPIKLFKRSLRIVACLVIFSFVYYALQMSSKFQPIIFIDYFKGVGNATIWIQSLWYLYAYISYLLCIPFIKHIARKIDYNLFLYGLIIAFSFNTLLPGIKQLTGYQISNNLFLANWLSTNIVFYPIVGYYIYHHGIDSIDKKTTAALNVLSIVSLITACILTYNSALREGLSWKSTSWFEFQEHLISTTIFLDLWIVGCNLQQHLSDRVKSLIISISSCTFGIYLIHPIFIYFFSPIDKVWILASQISFGNEMVGAILVCLLLMTVCWIIVFLIKRIPIINKLL